MKKDGISRMLSMKISFPSAPSYLLPSRLSEDISSSNSLSLSDKLTLGVECSVLGELAHFSNGLPFIVV